MMRFFYLLCGLVFGIGLEISGMTAPNKVISFLDFTSSDWNPALIFVLGSAIPTYFLVFLYFKRRKKTLLGHKISSPAPRSIDKNLILGSVLFGAGWGLAGLCPGPALTQIPTLNISMMFFVISMFLGFEVQRKFFS